MRAFAVAFSVVCLPILIDAVVRNCPRGVACPSSSLASSGRRPSRRARLVPLWTDHGDHEVEYPSLWAKQINVRQCFPLLRTRSFGGGCESLYRPHNFAFCYAVENEQRCLRYASRAYNWQQILPIRYPSAGVHRNRKTLECFLFSLGKSCMFEITAN